MILFAKIPLLFFINLGIVSFSFAQIDHWETVVQASDNWHYFVGASEPDDAWINNSFDESGWLQGSGGIGYGDGDDGTHVSTSSSIYLRRRFNVENIEDISQIILHADFDDAFVAYLNGVEIARANIIGKPPTHDAFAQAENEAFLYRGLEPAVFILDVGILESVLSNGENSIAFQVHNVNAESSDLSSNFFLSFGLKTAGLTYSETPEWFDSSIEGFSSFLPIIKINSFGAYIPDEPNINAEMGIIWNGENNLNISNSQPNEFFGNITIERRGQSSLSFPKNGYKIETKDEDWEEDMDVEFLGFPEEEDWVLHGPYSDKSLIRNVLAFHLANQLGSYSSRTRLVELVINERYEGIYVLMEKIKQGKDRVDVAKLNPEEIEGDDRTGGFIFKIDKGENHWVSSFGTAYQYVYPKHDVIVPEQESYLHAFVDSFETAIAHPEYIFDGRRYDEYIDINSFIDHFIIKEFAKDVDAYRISSYYYKEKDSRGGKIHAGPAWDFNLAFGNCDYCDGGIPTEWMYDNSPCGNDNPYWWGRFMEDPIFQNALKCRWEEIRVDLFTQEKIDAFLDEQSDLMSEATDRNFDRWPVLGSYVWPNLEFFNTHEEELDYVKSFVANRLAWIDENLPGTCINVGAESINSELLFSVYPNPFDDEVNIHFSLDSSKEVKVHLYNSVGELIINHNLGKRSGQVKEQLFSNNLLPGFYLLEINLDGRVYTRKLVK